MTLPATISGGETVLVDGLACAERLRVDDPVAFAILSEVLVQWEYRPEDRTLGGVQYASTPVLQLDANGTLTHFRWSNKDRSIQTIAAGVSAAEDTDAFYRAYRKLAVLVHTHTHTISLQRGTYLVMDNFRIAHGRMPYVGKRELKGAYALRRTFNAEQRLLELALLDGGIEDMDVPGPDIRTSLRSLQEGTREEYQAQGPLWAALVEPTVLAETALKLLRSMDGEHTRFGFQVNGYQHSLQTATRAYEDGADEEAVVVGEYMYWHWHRYWYRYWYWYW
jgi:hypothetical protein